jgi:hypothetical protein
MLVQWIRPPIGIVREYEARRTGRGDVGALILWATWTVEGMYYLSDLDEFKERGGLPMDAHHPDIVNISHVRWATSSSITAVDLCAAALARECCGWNDDKESDLRDFDSSLRPRKSQRFRNALSTSALTWVDRVLSDQRYKEIQGARNPLTHSRLIRRLYSTGPNYTEFVVASTGSALTTRDLVLHSRNFAKESVAEFLKVVETIA